VARYTFIVWNLHPLPLAGFDRRTPNVSYADFTVVEDTASGRIASLMGLVSQTWNYGGISFGCGQPEAIVTHPDYRRKGLVRKQLEVIHSLSAARGDQVQVIWGNPWYYRQFGYEYALEGLWDIHRAIRAHHIPAADDDTVAACSLRQVTRTDYPFIRQLHETGMKRNIINVTKFDPDWELHFEGWTKGAHVSRDWRIIEDPDGSPLGYLCFHDEAESGGFGVHQIELTSEAPYLQYMPGILRQLWDRATKLNRGTPPRDIKLYLGREHPAYSPISRSTHLEKGQLECLYIRVPDIVSYLRHITPALENNLAGSPAAGFTGTLRITLFRNGLEIDIESGRITRIDPWKADSFWHTPAFHDLAFPQLVFGHRRCTELEDIYVDCNVDDRSAVVLDSLFPPFKGTMWLGN
jgi:GNAT superfamily N-acetyltransferase